MMRKFLKNKEIKNAGWLIGGRIVQMILSFFVGILSARYLGPGNYGLINYATAYITFFSSLSNLGLNSVIIKEFSDNPNQQGIAIGTTIIFRGVASFLSAIMIVGIVSIIDKGETITIIVVALCSISLFFHVFDTINYWFQSKYLSKVTSLVTLLAYVIVSVYKIVLLINNKSVYWFAFASSVDYIAVGILLLLAYRKYEGPKLGFSLAKGRDLISRSYHYILSGMMVAIYGQTDKLMLKQMLDETTVGYYSTAVTLCSVWTFVLTAIIDSVYPTIIHLSEIDEEGFNRKNRQLYAIVFYCSMFVSLLYVIFGGFAIRILYGDAYSGAIEPLRVVTWYTAFTYLGVARNAWIVCKNRQKYLKFMYLGAAILNVILNFIFIPIMGATGAAFASLLTQISTSIVLPLFWKDMRPNSILMLEAILLRKIKKSN